MKATNSADLNSLDWCLAPGATISDRGENDNIVGLAAIKTFIRESKEKFQLHAEVRQMEEAGGLVKVTTLTSGDLPASPPYFRYEFTLAEGLITNIDILPGEGNAAV